MLRLAILDDYQAVALTYGDWSVLDGRVAITTFHDTEHDIDRLAERLAPFEIISTIRERTPFPRRLLKRLPRLRLLATTGMLNRAFDLDAARDHGVTVCGTASRWPATTELTWGLIISLARNLHRENQAMHAGAWQTTIGVDLAGKRLGLIGLGKIAAHVAQVAKVFGMDVVAWSRNLTEARCREVGAKLASKAELFETSDFISLHYVLSERSVGLIGAEDFARMKPSAYFINTSRGALIDEAALVDALERGTIAGAGLDVFDREPLAKDHPLRGLENALLTPHLGYVTHDQFRTYYGETIENVLAFLDGKPIRLVRPPPS